MASKDSARSGHDAEITRLNVRWTGYPDWRLGIVLEVTFYALSSVEFELDKSR